MQITENILEEIPSDFGWGKKWKALRIWKELREDTEYLYAFIIRYYGPGDFGTKKEDERWIGRRIKWIRGKKWQNDPSQPNYGQRVEEELETVVEEEWDEKKKTYVRVETPVNAKKTYEYIHKADDKDIVENYKTLVGRTTQGATQFYFVFGDQVRKIKPKDFWAGTVQEFADKFENIEEDTKEKKISKGKTSDQV